MSDGILCHGDGITVSVPMSNKHTVEQPNYWDEYFTPYSVFDSSSGRRYFRKEYDGAGHIIQKIEITKDDYDIAEMTDDNFNKHYEAWPGTNESLELLCKRRERRIKLLQYIAPGHRLSSVDKKSGYYSADEYVGKKPKHITPIKFNLNTLSSATTENYIVMDFVQRLMFIYGLDDRRTTFDIAWAALRAAYLDKWDIVEELIKILRGKIDASSIKRLKGHIASLMNETLL